MFGVTGLVKGGRSTLNLGEAKRGFQDLQVALAIAYEKVNIQCNPLVITLYRLRGLPSVRTAQMEAGCLDDAGERSIECYGALSARLAAFGAQSTELLAGIERQDDRVIVIAITVLAAMLDPRPYLDAVIVHAADGCEAYRNRQRGALSGSCVEVDARLVHDDARLLRAIATRRISTVNLGGKLRVGSMRCRRNEDREKGYRQYICLVFTVIHGITFLDTLAPPNMQAA